ncbi:MAG: 30S ribosome-binding factor RbfA [Aestuariivita sp.]|nr:30S ribosome-binding factor RbfA [Aestuariivita sp.]
MRKKKLHIGSRRTQRQLRVGELIRRTLADILTRQESHDPDLNRFSITVGEVRMSSDLKIATIYVLPLGGNDAQNALELLNENRHDLRRIVNKKTTLKFSPDLRFKLDETFDLMDNTRRLFESETVQRDIKN